MCETILYFAIYRTENRIENKEQKKTEQKKQENIGVWEKGI